MCATKNSIKKLFSNLFLIMFLLFLFPMDITLADSSVKTASTVDELIAHINNSAETIKITSSFEINKPIYITSKVTIYSDTAVTLKRAESYGGDLFVVGTDENNRNPILDLKKPALILGKAGSTSTKLTIDGNASNMTVDVYGTVIYITNSAVVDTYADVKITNCLKTLNDRTVNLDAARFSYPEYVGGAGVIIANGAYNLRGSIIENVSSQIENTEAGSQYGGAIYNNGNFTMYGGTVKSCSAYRGGMIYNYRIARIHEGRIEGNTAGYGGAIASSGSQVADLYVGKSADDDEATYGTEFVNNKSIKGGGGAIFSSSNSPIIIYGDTLFDGNEAVKHSGGAIYTSGTLTSYNSKFTNNKAAYYGGSVYHFYASEATDEEQLAIRQLSMRYNDFENNEALRGGAIAFASSHESKGTSGNLMYCKFKNNTAKVVVTETPVLDADGNPTYDESGNPVVTTSKSYGQGGALYIAGNSSVKTGGSSYTSNVAESTGGAAAVNDGSYFEISATSFTSNSSQGNGGALFIYDKATFKSSNGTFTSNSSANGYGGAIALTDVKKTTFVNDLKLNSNSAVSGGGLYIDNTAVSIPKATSIKNNTAENYGGGIFVTGSTLTLKNATIQENTAYRGAGVYAASNSVFNATTVNMLSNAATNRGGGMFVGTNATITLDSCALTGNTSTDAGGAMITDNSGTVTIKNSTISNNTGSRGGAMFFGSGENVMLNVTGTTFSGNTGLTGDGGALFLGSRKLTKNIIFTDCSFTENKTENAYGGAVYVYTDTYAEFNGVTFTSNTAKYGGGVFVENGAADFNSYTKADGTVKRTTFTSNTATKSAGALYVAGGVNVSGTTFDSNSSGYRGGAVYVTSDDAVGSFNANDVIFNKNTSTDAGGAVYTTKSGAITLNNSQLTENTGTLGGAVFFGSGTNVSFNAANSTFTKNKATGGGGGALYLASALATESIVLTDCEVSENSATGSGGGMYIGSGSYAVLNNLTAKKNSAKYGGIVYITSTNSALKINGATISGNTATKYPQFYSGNATVVFTVTGTLNDLDTPANTWTDVIKGSHSGINTI